jgi:hypothetical protein
MAAAFGTWRLMPCGIAGGAHVNVFGDEDSSERRT